MKKYIRQAGEAGLIDVNHSQIATLIEHMRREIICRGLKSKIGRGKAHTYGCGITGYDSTQYSYYEQLIKDTISQIRHGFTAYVFSANHIAEVLKIEPDAEITYLPSSESFAVALGKDDDE